MADGELPYEFLCRRITLGDDAVNFEYIGVVSPS